MVVNYESIASWLYGRIYFHILEKEYKRMLKMVDDISRENQLKGAKSTVMIHNGQIMTPSSRMLGVKASEIHPDLKERVDKLFFDLQEFANKRGFVRNTLSSLIPSDASAQDCRNALTDMIVCYIPELQKYKRTAPEAYHILNNQIKMHQWDKTKLILEHYIGNILVYS